MKTNIENRYDILMQTNVGFEFEFFTKLEARKITSSLGKALNKKIKIGIKKNSKDGKIGYHTGIKPTASTFKLERDFSGGSNMYEIVTGVLPFLEAKKILISTLQWISLNGYTTDESSVHLNISFNDTNGKMDDLNVLKFCLNFKDIEDSIYKDFPTRKNNIYCETITKIKPNFDNYTIYSDTKVPIGVKKSVLPIDSKYYGVNFQKLENNYLEFRYLGGKGYEKNIEKIAGYLDTFVLFTFDIMKNPNMDVVTVSRYEEKIAKFIKLLDGFRNYTTFRERFKDILILVDLKLEEQRTNIYFNQMKKFLFELIVHNGVKNAVVNFDTDVSRFQVKDAEIEKFSGMQNVEFLNCELYGIFESCDFYNCKIQNSLLQDCTIASRTEVHNSKVYDCQTETTTLLKESFVKNKYFEINSELDDCIVIGQKTICSALARIDKKTDFVDELSGEISKKA